MPNERYISVAQLQRDHFPGLKLWKCYQVAHRIGSIKIGRTVLVIESRIQPYKDAMELTRTGIDFLPEQQGRDGAGGLIVVEAKGRGRSRCLSFPPAPPHEGPLPPPGRSPKPLDRKSAPDISKEVEPC